MNLATTAVISLPAGFGLAPKKPKTKLMLCMSYTPKSFLEGVKDIGFEDVTELEAA